MDGLAMRDGVDSRRQNRRPGLVSSGAGQARSIRRWTVPAVLCGVLLLPNLAHGAPAFVADRGGANGGTRNQTLNVALTSNIPVGNFVIMGVQVYSSSTTALNNTVVTCSDSAGANTWNNAGELKSGNYYILQCWSYITTELTTANTLRVQFSGEGTTATVAHVFRAVEFTGVMDTNPVDQTSTGSGTGTAANSGTTGTTSQADEVLFASHAWGVNNTAVQGTGTGWTWYETNRTSMTGLSGYLVVAATGTYSSTSTYGVSTAWRADIVTYKGAPPTPTPTITNTATNTPTPMPPLPLDRSSMVQCMTCHDLHGSNSTDGNLTRAGNINRLCTDCHALADLTNGAHANNTIGALWPGGQYGSTHPQVTDTAKRGYCINCHEPHGWPDNAEATPAPGGTAADYPKLLVERTDLYDNSSDPDDAEDLCYTCHDGAPVADIKTQFAKTYHHPVKDSEQWEGRSAECRDCHNVHKARQGTHTAQTNQAGGALNGAQGAQLNSGLTFWQTLTAADFTAKEIVSGTDAEATLCFRCHSPYAGTLPKSPSSGTPGFQETDTAREFNPANVGNFAGTWAANETAGSFHPVLASAGNNLGATSNIIAPWTRTSLMTCSDCHESDTTTDPNGPHGSTAAFMLKGPNTTWNNTVVTTGTGMPTGTFCANCHNANFANSRFGPAGDQHWERNDHQIACFNCHAAIPHGTMRPGLLVAIGVDAGVPALDVTDSAPYSQPGTGDRLWIKSYPTNNTTNWDQNNCACNTSNNH